MTETEYTDFKNGAIGCDCFDVSIDPIKCKFIYEWADESAESNNPFVLIEWNKGSTIPQRFVVMTKIKLLSVVELVQTLSF